MFFKASTAKAEISFYERLPRHDNILSVHGCYFDNIAQRWCVAMEYLRHGNVRKSMITKAFPRHARSCTARCPDSWTRPERCTRTGWRTAT